MEIEVEHRALLIFPSLDQFTDGDRHVVEITESQQECGLA